MGEMHGIDFIFEQGGDFRAGMLDYIRRHFAGLLGEDIQLLDQPGGLDAIRAKYSL